MEKKIYASRYMVTIGDLYLKGIEKRNVLLTADEKQAKIFRSQMQLLYWLEVYKKCLKKYEVVNLQVPLKEENEMLR